MKIPVTMVLGFLLFGSGVQPVRSEPRVVAVAQEQSTENAQAQQREHEEYVKSIHTKLDDYEKKLDVLEARLSVLSGNDREDFKKTIDELRDQKKAIVSKLDAARNASPDAWRGVKADADSGLAKLQRSYDDVFRKIQLTPAAPSKNQQKSQ